MPDDRPTERDRSTDGAAVAVRVLEGMADVPAAAWDACAGDANPFVSHAFLAALEQSGSVGAEAGWLPRHLVVDDGAGGVLACAPLYVKSHSYGEYVFDHGWAQAYEQAGGRYYPKLLCGVPFTPVPGPRLLVRPDAPAETGDALAVAMIELARRLGLSSIHVNFTTEAESRRLGRLGFLQREGQQFHWTNDGYATFEDFLSALASRKRKQVRKERREAVEGGVRIRVLSGAEIRPFHWDAFHDFYMATSDKKWGWAYLTREFFHRLGATMADKVVLVIAEIDGKPVAGALNLRGADTLYGRNWGALAAFRFLHFECCYYQAIEYAIAHGLSRVEAGAQGQHKIQRGYLPVATHSAHWIADPGLEAAIANFLVRERRAVAAERRELLDYAPFRRDSDT